MSSTGKWFIGIVGLLVGVGSYLVFYTVYTHTLTNEGVTQQPLLGTSDTVSLDSNSDLSSDFLRLVESPETKYLFAQETELLNLLSQTDEAGLIDLLEQSKSISLRKPRWSTQKKIIRRIAQLNPSLALESVQSFPSQRTASLKTAIFREWSSANTSALIEYVSTMDEANKRLALSAVVQVNIGSSEEEFLRIGRMLGIEQYARLLIQEQTVNAQYLLHPQQAWTAVIHDEFHDSLQRDLLAKIATGWIEEDGLEVVALISQPDAGWREPLVGLGVLREVVSKYAANDPQQTFETVSAFAESQGGRFVQDTILSVWTRLDPLAALEAVKTTGLPTTSQLLRVIVGSWVRDDPLGVLEQISHIPAPLRSYAREQAITRIADSQPQSVIKLIKDEDNQITKRVFAPILVERWGFKDSSAAFEWVVNESYVEDMRDELLYIVLVNMADYDPEKAFELALQYPNNNPGAEYQGIDAWVIDAIAKRDSDLALDLVSRVSDDSKVNAYSSIGVALLEKMDFDRAIALSDQLSESAQSQYFEYIFWQWSEMHYWFLYDYLTELPEEHQPLAASNLYSHGLSDNFLNDVQKNRIKLLIKEDDPVFERFP